MVAHVCSSTGWTWDYVADNIDIPRLDHLNKYWNKYPPVHVLTAAKMGYKPPETVSRETEIEDVFGGGNKLSESEFEAMLKQKGLL